MKIVLRDSSQASDSYLALSWTSSFLTFLLSYHVNAFKFWQEHLSSKPFCSYQNLKGFAWKAKSIRDGLIKGSEEWDDGNTLNGDECNYCMSLSFILFVF